MLKYVIPFLLSLILSFVLAPLIIKISNKYGLIVKPREESFHFLGFTTRLINSQRTGREFPLIRIREEYLHHIKTEIRSLTCSKSLALSKEEVIKKINYKMRGLLGPFRQGHCKKDLTALKWFLEESDRNIYA